jgi:aspartokinase/homoserine dehydrogenase 1
MFENILTTLKCNGSDFSTTIMGMVFLAKKVTIWTNVDGVIMLTIEKVPLATLEG